MVMLVLGAAGADGAFAAGGAPAADRNGDGIFEDLAAPVCTAGPAFDDHSHGTHVAGTIEGTGAASGGAERGVAPGATLVELTLRFREGGTRSV